MTNEPHDIERRSGGPWIRAGCAWCGDVELGVAELGIHPSSNGSGLVEFTCRSCGRLNVRRVSNTEVAVLANVGATRSSRLAPFELLEPHAGPPIGYDEIIDFHEAITRLDDVTRLGRRAPAVEGADLAPAPERDAA